MAGRRLSSSSCHDRPTRAGQTEAGPSTSAPKTQPDQSQMIDQEPRRRRDPDDEPEITATGSDSDRAAASEDPKTQQTTTADAPPEELSPIRTAIRNFSSQWFLIPQGTGITAVVLYQLDRRFKGLDIIAHIIWALTGVSLVVILLIYVLRATLFPRHVAVQIGTVPAELACLSSVSIALTSVAQMAALTTQGAGGWTAAAVGFWWFNTGLALASVLFMPYVFAKVQASPGDLAGLSPATLLPAVAAITGAAGGGVVVSSVDSNDAHIVLVSYLLIAIGMPLAAAITVAYLVRLLDGSPPARGKVYQEMILAGPWGQGSFALQALGQAMVRNAGGLAGNGDAVGEAAVGVLGYGSMFLGFLSWAHGTFWLVFATVGCVQSHVEAWRARRRGFLGGEGEEYTLAVWSLVFPWGVYTNATVKLGRLLDSDAVKDWSTILAVVLVILMSVNLVLTAKGLWSGQLLGNGRPRRLVDVSEASGQPKYA